MYRQIESLLAIIFVKLGLLLELEKTVFFLIFRFFLDVQGRGEYNKTATYICLFIFQ